MRGTPAHSRGSLDPATKPSRVGAFSPGSKPRTGNPSPEGIRSHGVWGMARAMAWKRRSIFPIAGMAIAPIPLEAWVVGEIGLDGLVDLREPWPLFL